jgi:hypothetical protein
VTQCRPLRLLCLKGHPQLYDDVQDEEYDNSLEEPTPELHDEYVGAEVFLPMENDKVHARVLCRVCDGDNWPIGIRHHNPMLDL